MLKSYKFQTKKMPVEVKVKILEEIMSIPTDLGI